MTRHSPLAGRPIPLSPANPKIAMRLAILTGPIVPTLMRLALPTIAVLVAQTMVGIAETFYVSWLGTDAIVGVSVVFPVWMLMTMASAGGLGNGVASAVARATGSGRDQDANDHVLHAVVLATILGVAFTVAMRILGPALFAALGARGGALREATSYSNWLFLGATPIWIVNLCSAALRGVGNVKTPALVTLIGAIVLIPLSPFLIFGIGPFHGFGVAGAGIAVTAYYVAASLVLLGYMTTGRAGLRLARARLRWPLFRDVLSVGLLASIAAVQLNLAVILVTGAMGHFGIAELAGYGIASRLDYLLIPILFGLGSSLLTMVGICVGASDIRRAKRIALAGAVVAAVFAETVGAIVALYPPVWIAIFSRDPAILHAGSLYLRSVAPVYAAMATTFILAFISQATGKPLWTTLASTIRLVIAAGIGWLAVENWHADMLTLSLIVAAAQVVSALICIAAFRFGAVWPEQSERN